MIALQLSYKPVVRSRFFYRLTIICSI